MCKIKLVQSIDFVNKMKYNEYTNRACQYQCGKFYNIDKLIYQIN